MQSGVPPSGALQRLPQPLQFCRSALVSTQEPPQLVVPLGQLVMHAPPEQTASALQGLPQAPQLALSLLMSTHWPPQAV